MSFVYALVGLLAIAVIIDGALRRFAARRIADMFENVPPFNVVTEGEQPHARQISITTSDGVKLAGSILRPDRDHPCGLVIFFPELSGNHWMAHRYCAALAAEGFAILAFDFRNQGHSQRVDDYTPIHWITEHEMTDVAAVMEYIESDHELSTLPLFAFGVSRGGVAALMAAARYPRILAVTADSAFDTMPMAKHFVERFSRYVIPQWFYSLLPSWHVNLALKQGLELSERRRNCRYAHLTDEVDGLSQTPVLLISGTRDSYVSVDVARMLQRVIGPTADLWIVPGAKHNMARATAGAEYDARVTQHFLRPASVVSSATQEVDPTLIAT